MALSQSSLTAAAVLASVLEGCPHSELNMTEKITKVVVGLTTTATRKIAILILIIKILATLIIIRRRIVKLVKKNNSSLM